MSLWTGFRRRVVDEEIAEGVEPEEIDYLSDMLTVLEAGIEEQKEFNAEALELFRGMLEELQAIRDKIPSFHEGVEKALEIRAEKGE